MHAELLGPSAGSSERVLDVRKLDYLKLNYRQEIDRLTKEMLDQAQQSDFGKQAVMGSDLKNHKYVADIAVAKISKNLSRLQEIEE